MIDRRSLMLAGSAGLIGGLVPGTSSAFNQMKTEGTLLPPAAAVAQAKAIIDSISSDFMKAMEDLASLSNLKGASGTPIVGPDNRPYNERWPIHANPLLVQMWRDLGYNYIKDDCLSWCGIAMGWCLKRSGRKPPADCASSQKYLTYGTEVKTPARGDIVIFTNYDNPGKGHVTIFRSSVNAKTIRVLGGNQQLSEDSNCPSGFPTSIIDEREMDVDTRHTGSNGRPAGHYVHRFIRPPEPTLPPTKPGGAVIF